VLPQVGSYPGNEIPSFQVGNLRSRRQSGWRSLQWSADQEMTSSQVSAFLSFFRMDRREGTTVQHCFGFGGESIQLVPPQSVRSNILLQVSLHTADRSFPETPEVRSPGRDEVPVDIIPGCEVGQGFFQVL